MLLRTRCGSGYKSYSPACPAPGTPGASLTNEPPLTTVAELSPRRLLAVLANIEEPSGRLAQGRSGGMPDRAHPAQGCAVWAVPLRAGWVRGESRCVPGLLSPESQGSKKPVGTTAMLNSDIGVRATRLRACGSPTYPWLRTPDEAAAPSGRPARCVSRDDAFPAGGAGFPRRSRY